MKEITETIVTHSRVSPRRRSTSKYRPPKNNTDTSNTNNPDVFKNPSTKDSNSNNHDNLNINSSSINDTDNQYDDKDNNKRGRSQHQPSRVTLPRATATWPEYVHANEMECQVHFLSYRPIEQQF